jgi:predicted O-methyltransferase YrrM
MRNAKELAALRLATPALIAGCADGRDDVIRALQFFCVAGRGVEVGTFNGTFAYEILHRTVIAELVCVDPYRSYEDFHDAINTLDLEAVFQQAQRHLSPFRARVRFLRELSTNAAKHFKDDELDFVYVDGNHQSDFVMADLRAWWPKLKPGGLMLGDDAVDTTDAGRDDKGDIRMVHQRDESGTETLYGEYGVLHAVKRFAAFEELDFIHTGTQFILPKPFDLEG